MKWFLHMFSTPKTECVTWQAQLKAGNRGLRSCLSQWIDLVRLVRRAKERSKKRPKGCASPEFKSSYFFQFQTWAIGFSHILPRFLPVLITFKPLQLSVEAQLHQAQTRCGAMMCHGLAVFQPCWLRLDEDVAEKEIQTEEDEAMRWSMAESCLASDRGFWCGREFARPEKQPPKQVTRRFVQNDYFTALTVCFGMFWISEPESTWLKHERSE